MPEAAEGFPQQLVQGVAVPAFLYGTAWKEERTAALVEQALAAGFRGIDTANQRKHYYEAGVGSAMIAAAAASSVKRSDLFLQTKYTYAEGQDHRLPYSAGADFPTQVRQSFASSLEHLGLGKDDQLDSYLIHGPRARRGLSAADRQVWRTMEELQRQGRVRLIGISNVTAEQVGALCEFAEVRPAFVQNRCYASLGWDREVRDICRSEGVVYQGFSLLTANRAEMEGREVGAIATRYGKTRAQVVFRFALQAGMICLTGTTNPKHMREDLVVFDFQLTSGEMQTIASLSG